MKTVGLEKQKNVKIRTVAGESESGVFRALNVVLLPRPHCLNLYPLSFPAHPPSLFYPFTLTYYKTIDTNTNRILNFCLKIYLKIPVKIVNLPHTFTHPFPPKE